MKKKVKKAFERFLPNRLLVIIRNYRSFKRKQKNEKQKEYIFDVIFSVGNACRPAYYLQKHNLRLCASPLDWMMWYSLDTVANLYESKFKSFFINFSESGQIEKGFVDIENNITSIHYKEIGYDNIAFNKKMTRRFEKMNEKLMNADKICFISERNENHDAFTAFLQKMGKIYSGKKITLINVKHNEKIDGIIEQIVCNKIKISQQLELIEYEFNDIHPNGNHESNPNFWIGNENLWDIIIGKISIKLFFLSYVFKNDAM